MIKRIMQLCSDAWCKYYDNNNRSVYILLITQVHEIIVFILLHEKFCNLIGFLHVKTTNLLWVVVQTNNSMICT